MALYLRYAVRSDVGLARDNNEDSVYAGPRLLAIADGMGGHAAGEVASKIVIGTFEHLDEDRPISDLMGALHDTVVDANHRIAEAVKDRKELEGMGTTLTALRFLGSQVGLVHVGDSRAYLLRNHQLSQITHDDTYVQYLVDSGKLTPEEAKDHPRKSVILRALLGSDVEADVSIREARASDRYLLCSDGLSDVVSPETIAETLRLPDPQDAADRLVELALRGGGPDNITVIVADVINARIGDRIDDVPILAGAFVDPSAADAPSADGSPAERAKALTPRPAPTGQPAQPSRRKRRGGHPWALAVGLVVLIAAALGGIYAWSQTQYFVWRADGDVAIYRGVNADFGPLKFFNVYRITDLRLTDLQSTFRDQVMSGITAHSESGAEQIIKNLHNNVKPLCPAASDEATASASPTQTPSASASRSASRSASTSTSPAAHHSSSSRSSTTRSHRTRRHTSGSTQKRIRQSATSDRPTASKTPSTATTHPTTASSSPSPHPPPPSATLRPPNCRPRR